MNSDGHRCDGCSHWRRLSAYRGSCLKAPFFSTSYRLVGISDEVEIYEETKPDHWCVLFEDKPSEDTGT